MEVFLPTQMSFMIPRDRVPHCDGLVLNQLPAGEQHTLPTGVACKCDA